MSPQERQQLLAEWQGELITFGEAREQLRKKGIAFENDEEARNIIEGESGFRDNLDESKGKKTGWEDGEGEGDE